jgi:hypothetical protein
MLRFAQNDNYLRNGVWQWLLVTQDFAKAGLTGHRAGSLECRPRQDFS